ncbi:MAG: hypothetical protein CMJ83_17690 [Planctomycetes bacterium]|nr:hypothetical protein [Planctomycetota bacterium]
MLGAAAAFIGSLLPIRLPNYEYWDSGSGKWLWPLFETTERSPLQWIALYLPPVAAIAGFVLALALAGRARAIWLTCLAGSCLVAALVAWGDGQARPFGTVVVPMPVSWIREVAVVGTAIGIAVFLVAPALRRGYLLAASCASVSLLFLFLPFRDGPLIEGLVGDYSWKEAWGGNLKLLLHLGFAGLMMVAYAPGVVARAPTADTWSPHRPSGTAFRQAALIMAILVAALSPLSMLRLQEEMGLAYPLSIMLRYTLIYHGLYVVLGVGIVQLLTGSVARDPAPDSAPDLSIDAAPDHRGQAASGPRGLPDSFGHALGIGAGCAMIASFILPIVVERRHSKTIVWTWDLMERAEGGEIIGFLLTPIGGIVAIVLAATLKGRARAVALLSIASAALLIGLVVAGDQFDRVRGFRGVGEIFAVATLIILGLAATFTGTSLVRAAPHRRVGFLIAAIAASVVLFLLVVPLFPSDTAALGILFKDGFWESGWSIGLVLLYMLGYCGFCLSGYAPWRSPEVFGRIGGGLGVALLVALPVAVTLIGVSDGDPSVVTMFSFSLKYFSSAYATLLLLSLGVGGLILSAATEPARPSDPEWDEHGALPPSLPSLAAEELRARLSALEELLADGVLTHEEYEAKRGQIIEGWDI